MKNVMVCVTQQKTCDRLIRYGHEVLDGQEGELFIIHVAPKDFKILGSSEEGEALDYLYGKAIEYGANFGWDADTIGTMVGSLAGAFRGTAGLKPEWIDTLEKNHSQKPLAESLYQAAAAKKERQREVLRQYDLLAE